MKKLFFTFALLGLFAHTVPKDAAAQEDEQMTYPGTFDICGTTCLCWDVIDYEFYEYYYC